MDGREWREMPMLELGDENPDRFRLLIGDLHKRLKGRQSMSRRPAHPCVEQGCPALVWSRQSRCQAHEKQRQQAYNTQQRPARHAFYHTLEWRDLSKQVLEEQPYCACGARSTQADHLLSVRERPDLALVRRNLVGRCRPCHSRKTAREDRRWGQR